MKSLWLAIFFLLKMTSANAGEWYSAGAVPAPPYWPSQPAHYSCQIRVYTGTAKKQYRSEYPVEFVDSDWRKSPIAKVSFTTRNSDDPWGDGQQISLHFEKGLNSEDQVVLTLIGKIEGRTRSIATFQSAQSSRVILGSLSVEVARSGQQGVRSMQITAHCERLP